MVAIRRMIAVVVGLEFCWTANATPFEPAETAVSSAAPTSATASATSAADLRGAAKEAMRLSLSAQTTAERRRAARKLVQAFVALQDDQSLSVNERSSLFHQVRSRLLAVEQGLRSELSRVRAHSESIAEVPAGKPRDVARQQTAAKNPAPKSVVAGGAHSVLAQQAGGAGQANGAAPPGVNPPNAGARPNNMDDGEALLALIQRVIRPATWDVNGGPSSGVYFQPLHALVISAPAEVHTEIGGVLGGLRQ